MVVNERPIKRSRTKVIAYLADFFSFPGSDEFPDSFRSNLRPFIARHAQPPTPSSLFPGFLVSQIFLRIGELVKDSDPSSPEVVSLVVVEEDVARSRYVYCDQCRVIGWSRHPVCGKRYHFIIRRNNSAIDRFELMCRNCGDLLLLSDHRCKTCNYELTAAGYQDWMHLQLEDTSHLLHGVVHANGYGHLLRVNGREGGSKFLSGCDIMNFWDRLCRKLRARKISVMDVSKKYGLEFRLLHAITNGHTWYGSWGFEFGTGSFALTLDDYRKAVDSLSETPLSFFFQERKPRTRLQDVITFYQALSECQLSITRELFCFLIGLIRKTERSEVANKTKNESSSTVLCTWTIDDIERVQQSMIKVLQVAGGHGWVSWRALKGATFRLGSSEFLDYCLRVLDGKALDDERMVLSRCNPESDAIEYRLVSRSDTGRPLSVSGSSCPSKDHILRDLNLLYDALLNPHTMLSYRLKATHEQAVVSAIKLLDCKQFVKDYESERVAVENPFSLTLSCQVQLVDQPKDYTAPPPELIFLPLKATLADLKTLATKAFRNMYVLFKRFKVDELIGYDAIDESSQIKFLIGSSGSIIVRGRLHLLDEIELDELERFRMERGVENWTVSCTCGAKDDDGERMLACDTCGIWQHTRCARIDDRDLVPESFKCFKCRSMTNSARYSKTGRRLTFGSNGKYNNSNNSKTNDKILAISKKASHPCRTGVKSKDWALVAAPISYSEIESPAESGISGISNCKEEFPDASQTCFSKMGMQSCFETVNKYKDEDQGIDPCYLDACYMKTESPNLSGTTSEETSAFFDTCSSKIGFTIPIAYALP